MSLKYTTVITCKAHPLQIEGLTEDGRTYYFRARNGAWYLSIVTLATDDFERVLPVNPVASGPDAGDQMSLGGIATAKRIIHEYVTQKGLVNTKSRFSNVAYDGVTPNQKAAEREVKQGAVTTLGVRNAPQE